MLFSIVLTLILVFLNGFFVAAEFALVKVRMSQIEMRIQAGSRIAAVAKHILGNLDSYLSASQLGITLASLALGWIGEDVAAQLVMGFVHLLHLRLDAELAHSIAGPIAFVTITALHIILGEQAPKWFAIQRPEAVTMSVALPMRVFYGVFKPCIVGLNYLSNKFLRMLGIEATHEEVHSAEELQYLLKRGQETGAIESSEHELIQNVFTLSERTARQIMVSRTRMSALEITTPVQQLLERVIEEGFSRLPVYKDSLDNIVGVVYTKDILTMAQHPELIVLQDIVRPAYFVHESKSIRELLREFQKRRIHMAIVIDDFGGTAGMVTLEDILEEIVGDIQDEFDEDQATVNRVDDGEFEIAASTLITDVNKLLPKPLPEDERYETLSGYINVLFGKIPNENELLVEGGYMFTILKRNKRAVELVRITYLGEEVSSTNVSESGDV
ncbi:MAG: hemolysin family protein [Bacteroidota bacterium]|nr:hemolysin family protein [Candidatus Kapabacteria bacterium]MDW8219667.1 hemolysin family protein [Bacteroidota bacterium]